MTPEKIVFSKHVEIQMKERGTTKEEILETIKKGESVPAKTGRKAFRKNFPFEKEWNGKWYGIKQVMSVIEKRKEKTIVITVYTFYF